MAAMSRHEEGAMPVTQCLDFCQRLAGKSLTFSFSLTIGTSFSFSVDTMGKGALAPQKKKKKPTPSTQRRNARRRAEFLKKKDNASTDEKSQSEPVSVEEAEAPPKVLHYHPSPSPSSERRQVLTIGRERTRSTFSQLDGDPPSSPDTPFALQSSSPPPSAPAQSSVDYDELIAYLKAQASRPFVPLFAKDQPVFSSSCDKSEAS